MNSTSGASEPSRSQSTGSGQPPAKAQGRPILGMDGKPLKLDHLQQKKVDKTNSMAPKIPEQVARLQGSPPQTRLRGNPRSSEFYNQRMKGRRPLHKGPPPPPPLGKGPPPSPPLRKGPPPPPPTTQKAQRPTGGRRTEEKYDALRKEAKSQFSGMDVDQRIQHLEQRKADVQVRIERFTKALQEGNVPAEKLGRVKQAAQELVTMRDRTDLALQKAYAERESQTEDTDTASPARTSSSSDAPPLAVQDEGTEAQALRGRLERLLKAEHGDHSSDAERMQIQARLSELEQPALDEADVQVRQLEPVRSEETERIGIVADAGRRGEPLDKPLPKLVRQPTHVRMGQATPRELKAQDYQLASKQAASLYALASIGDRDKEVNNTKQGEEAPQYMKLKARADGSVTAVESSRTAKMGRQHKRAIISAFKDTARLMNSPALADKDFAKGLVARLIRPDTIVSEAKKLMSEEEIAQCEAEQDPRARQGMFLGHFVDKMSSDGLKLHVCRAVETKVQRYAIERRGGAIHDNRRQLAVALGLFPNGVEGVKQGQLDEALKKAVAENGVDSLVDRLAGDRKFDIRLAGLLVEAAAGVQAQQADIRINVDRMATLQDQLAILSDPAVLSWLAIDPSVADEAMRSVANAEVASQKAALEPLSEQAQTEYRQALMSASTQAFGFIETVMTQSRKQTGKVLIHTERDRDSLERAWNSFILREGGDEALVQRVIDGRKAIEDAGRYGESILQNMDNVRDFANTVYSVVQQSQEIKPEQFAKLREVVGVPIPEKAEKRRYTLGGQLMPYQPQYRKEQYRDTELDALTPSMLNVAGLDQVQKWAHMGIERPPAGPEALRANLRKQFQYVQMDQLPFKAGQIELGGRMFDVDELNVGKDELRKNYGLSEETLLKLGIDASPVQFMVYFGTLCDASPEQIAERIHSLSDEQVEVMGEQVRNLDATIDGLIYTELSERLGDDFMLLWCMGDRGVNLDQAARERLDAVDLGAVHQAVAQKIHSASAEDVEAGKQGMAQLRERSDALIAESLEQELGQEFAEAWREANQEGRKLPAADQERAAPIFRALADELRAKI